MKISKLHLQLQVTKEYEKNFKNLKGAMTTKVPTGHSFGTKIKKYM